VRLGDLSGDRVADQKSVEVPPERGGYASWVSVPGLPLSSSWTGNLSDLRFPRLIIRDLKIAQDAHKDEQICSLWHLLNPPWKVELLALPY
jgi:hypothetical protein